MKIEEYIDYHLPEIIEVARLAPSVHNTQPWLVQAVGDCIEVAVDPEYTLSDGDPTGRQTVISLGIFAEAIRMGAEHTGLAVKKTIYVDKKAIIRCALTKRLPVNNDELTLLKNRCTDRSIYTPVNIGLNLVEKIEHITKNNDIHVQVVTERNVLDVIAELTAKGIRLALSNPAFRKELSGYLVLPWSAKKRGIAVKSLYLTWLLEVTEPLLMRLGIGLDAESKLEKKRWLSASAVVIITSKGDMPKYWFEVGRAYLQVSLAIEEAGLSQATSASIVEASNFHEDVEHLLKTNQRIQSILRIGAGSKTREHSPRVDAKELITT